MPRIGIGELIVDPDFSQTFTVYRKSGSWSNGRYTQTETTVTMIGTVTVAGAKDINQVPEGDRTSQVMSFYSNQEIYVSRNSTSAKGTSDEILWNGNRYRIYQVYPYLDYGYYKAIGVSMKGA